MITAIGSPLFMIAFLLCSCWNISICLSEKIKISLNNHDQKQKIQNNQIVEEIRTDSTRTSTNIIFRDERNLEGKSNKSTKYRISLRGSKKYVFDRKLSETLGVEVSDKFAVDFNICYPNIDSTTKRSCPPYAMVEEEQVSANFAGTEYYFQKEYLSVEDHEVCARAWGGHLASIESEEEQHFITRTFFTNLKEISSFWIGGKRLSGSSGTDGSVTGWRWLDGTTWGYTNWHFGEPNNYLKEEKYLKMYLGGYWNDESKSQQAALYKRVPSNLSPSSPTTTQVEHISTSFPTATFSPTALSTNSDLNDKNYIGEDNITDDAEHFNMRTLSSIDFKAPKPIFSNENIDYEDCASTLDRSTNFPSISTLQTQQNQMASCPFKAQVNKQCVSFKNNDAEYFFSVATLPWEEHEKCAQEWGGHLNFIDSRKELDFVSTFVPKILFSSYSFQMCWISSATNQDGTLVHSFPHKLSFGLYKRAIGSDRAR
uniref:C-type lectin domain-containing protein n=1 Tax=Corethron hystrix TaxID=216773 RepID=A0A7S1BT32_9STRA|mmetsp:Transcript_38510/g.89528  ORF Transcript_38510/g.89528 Transcript_38510/m.89528 type:complete len:484 (+) Transcript_38510:59-1510(+)